MYLFSRGGKRQDLSPKEGLEIRIRRSLAMFRAEGLGDEGVVAFESLAESQQDIGGRVRAVAEGLGAVQGLVNQVAVIEDCLAEAFEEHRRLALAKATLHHDRDHAESLYNEKLAEASALHSELMSLRAEKEAVDAKLEQTLLDLEGVMHRHHLLNAAKVEVDENLAQASLNLSVVRDEMEGLRLEAEALKQQVELGVARIAELTSSYNEAHEKSVFLANRCDSYELTVQLSADEVVNLKRHVETLAHERDLAYQARLQKESEAASSRDELSRLFDKYQNDSKVKETELNRLKDELDSLRASIRMLEQINGGLNLENDKQTTQLRHFQEAQKQIEMSVSRLEGKERRLATNLEHMTAAKKELEQSRSTMAARLDSTTQRLRARDAEVNRLEGEVSRLSSQMEEQSASSRDAIDTLSQRIFELEKDLNSQKRETAFFSVKSSSGNIEYIKK